MGFDIRIPIGYLFTIFGAMLVLFAMLTAKADMYNRSLGININLWWGAVLLIFGLLMIFAARKSQAQMEQARKADRQQGQSPAKSANP
jgi:multisubunit Na+/H+ antiporter MnhG subunit